MLKRLDNYFLKLNRFKFVFQMTIYSVFLPIFPLIVIDFAFGLSSFERTTDNWTIFNGYVFLRILYQILIAPALETILCQLIPISLMSRISLIKNRYWFQITISAIIFALSHTRYSSIEQLTVFISGIVFAYAFILTIQKEGRMEGAFRDVFFIHAFTNMTCLALAYIYSLLS